MNNIRKYGMEPFSIALLHGGPGAAGGMKPVAEELSKNFGILEPLQTADSVEGQVEELKMVLEQNASLPVTLVGYSWGAWLAYILTAKYPRLVKKLVLVGSGPFEQKYIAEMKATRECRLTEEEKVESQSLENSFKDPTSDKIEIFKKFGKISHHTDSYNPDNEDDESSDLRPDIYEKVWPEAAKLRQTGELLEMGRNTECPVVAIHGNYDPHPASGVNEPLSKIIKNFNFILLKHCGHTPWIEKEAKDEFYKILRKELAENF